MQSMVEYGMKIGKIPGYFMVGIPFRRPYLTHI